LGVNRVVCGLVVRATEFEPSFCVCGNDGADNVI